MPTIALANTQGEIRVGPSHQAKLPLLKVFSSSSLSNNNDDGCSLREELLWKNSTNDLDLSVYLQAARSIAAFAGMCDRGLAEDMYEVAQRDDTTINALTILHNHDYDCKRAIQALVKCPIPKGIDRKWSDDDQKKFIKGLRQYGKNFFRIRKDLLSHKQTSELIEFYYLWKKTAQAQSSRPRRRQRPCSTLANVSTTPTPTKQRNTKTNNKDESDDDNQTTTDGDESLCRHCQSSSKDLQTIGRDNQLLCYDCRMYYKKYGEMPSVNLESSRYLFKPLNETSSSMGKRKRTRAPTSPDEYNSSLTRSKKRTRVNDKLPCIKQEVEEEEEEEIIIKKEEQENEKPSSSSTTITTTTNSSLHIKIEDSNSTIHTPTPCKQELHSPSTILSNNSTKILLDHAKQNNTSLLLSSHSSAFSRTLKKSSLSKDSDEIDSSSKSITMLNGDIIPIGSVKDNDLSNDDGNTSDNSTTTNHEVTADLGPAPLSCEKECYNKSQGIVLLQVYDRSSSQNTCARTDIILKRGSRTRRKPSELQQSHDIPSSNSSSTTTTNIKQENRNISKLSFSLDKGPSILHPSGPSFSHPDPLLFNHNNPLFHPLPMHTLAGAGKPPLGFPSPFGPLPPDNGALRHLDPLGLRLMNPAAAAHLFSTQSPFSPGINRPTPGGLDPSTAALLLDPRYRSMISSFNNPSSSPLVPLPPSSSNHSPSISAHNNANGASLPPPPILPFPNHLSGLSHGNPLLHPGGPLPPGSLEAMHNFARERELMSLMLANNNRFDPMTLTLANSFQMPRFDDLSRMNSRERSIREHNENELRRFSLDMERQHFRFPFPHQPDELLRRY
ncbi:hypothetical protein I4U23_000384 [Adineta vaga]|nr:hypothetical protein I4U23_000384 [Adineta vaga]